MQPPLIKRDQVQQQPNNWKLCAPISCCGQYQEVGQIEHYSRNGFNSIRDYKSIEDNACNVVDDSEEHGHDEKNTFALSEMDHEVLDSKLFLNPKAVLANQARRWTNDTAGSVVMWHHAANSGRQTSITYNQKHSAGA